MAIPAPFTDQQIADQLTRDGAYWRGDNGDNVIYYSFSADLGYYGTGTEYGLNATQQTWVNMALGALSDTFDLTFVEGSEPANTRFSQPVDYIQFVNDTNGGTYAQSWVYGDGGHAFSFIYFDQTWSSNQSANLSYGSYGYMTMLHEILHALGLEHPGNYNAGSGGTITYQTNAEFEQDTHRYTVMSYFDSYEDGSGAVFYDTVNNEWVYPRTLMVYDILAMTSGGFASNFSGYDFNTTTRAGDTVYGYNASAGIDAAYDFSAHPAPVLTVYDAGGEDWLDLSGDTVSTKVVISYDSNGVAQSYSLVARTDTLIDLREGAYSSTHGMTYNIGIAFGTIIENAVGTMFNDEIHGNAADNELYGGSDGADTLYGYEGNDRLFGGIGNDALHGGANDDYLDGGSGVDQLYGEGGNDTIVYDANDDWAGGGVDGGSGLDTLLFETTLVAIDLLTYGFEQAALYLVDTAAELWSEIYDYYNSNYDLTEQHTFFDDGTSEIIVYDVDNTETWSTWTRTYDAASVLVSEVYAPDVATQLHVLNDGTGVDITVGSFDPVQDQGQAAISPDGTAITITGNVWKVLDLPKTITANTVISFDLKSDATSEILGIGFGNGSSLTAGHTFQLDGTQRWDLQDFNGLYTTGSGFVHYDIPVGDFFTGSFTTIVLVGDDDRSAATDATFQNITFSEVTPTVAQLAISDNGANVSVDFGSFDPVQDQGQATISLDGTAITITGNVWKVLDLPKTITANTVISFDLKSDATSEILGIGFGNGSSLTAGHTFQLDGTQRWDLQDFNGLYTTGSGFVHYDIPVGNFFTGSFTTIVLVGDDDRSAATDATFQNISFSEVTQLAISDNGANVSVNFGSFDPVQDQGQATVSLDGTAITITGNVWKVLDLPKTITANTVISFDLKSDATSEILGIGFGNGSSLTAGHTFQLDGTQRWDLQDFNGLYTTGSGFVHYDIPVGNFFTGDFTTIVLVGDDDRSAATDATFQNITFSEVTPTVTQLAISDNGANVSVDFGSFDPVQDQGQATVSPDGTAITITGNVWKVLDLPKTVTADTVIGFDFKSDATSEILGIGFGNGSSLASGNTFQLDGVQQWGLQDFDGLYTTGSGFVHYDIPVGNFFTGDFTTIALIGDDDRTAATDATFQNITFSEVTSAAAQLQTANGDLDLLWSSH